MIKNFDYYQAPPDEVFEDLKSTAIRIWESFDNTYGYVDEKKSRLEGIENVSDNAWYILAMFDHGNKIRMLVETELELTKQYITTLLELERREWQRLTNKK